jgi:hypothetical protein
MADDDQVINDVQSDSYMGTACVSNKVLFILFIALSVLNFTLLALLIKKNTSDTNKQAISWTFYAISIIISFISLFLLFSQARIIGYVLAFINAAIVTGLTIYNSNNSDDQSTTPAATTPVATTPATGTTPAATTPAATTPAATTPAPTSSFLSNLTPALTQSITYINLFTWMITTANFFVIADS